MNSEEKQQKKELEKQLQQRFSATGMSILSASFGSLILIPEFTGYIKAGKWLSALGFLVLNALLCCLSWAFTQAIIVSFLGERMWFHKLGKWQTPLLIVLSILLCFAAWWIILNI